MGREEMGSTAGFVRTGHALPCAAISAAREQPGAAVRYDAFLLAAGCRRVQYESVCCSDAMLCTAFLHHAHPSCRCNLCA